MAVNRDIEGLLRQEMTKEANRLAREHADGKNNVVYSEKDFEIQAKAVAAALNPVIDQLTEVVDSIETMHRSLPNAFTSIGAGVASAGIAGSSTYSASTAEVTKSIVKLKRDLKTLKS